MNGSSLEGINLGGVRVERHGEYAYVHCETPEALRIGRAMFGEGGPLGGTLQAKSQKGDGYVFKVDEWDAPEETDL